MNVTYSHLFANGNIYGDTPLTLGWSGIYFGTPIVDMKEEQDGVRVIFMTPHEKKYSAIFPGIDLAFAREGEVESFGYLTYPFYLLRYGKYSDFEAEIQLRKITSFGCPYHAETYLISLEDGEPFTVVLFPFHHYRLFEAQPVVIELWNTAFNIGIVQKEDFKKFVRGHFEVAEVEEQATTNFTITGGGTQLSITWDFTVPLWLKNDGVWKMQFQGSVTLIGMLTSESSQSRLCL